MESPKFYEVKARFHLEMAKVWFGKWQNAMTDRCKAFAAERLASEAGEARRCALSAAILSDTDKAAFEAALDWANSAAGLTACIA